MKKLILTGIVALMCCCRMMAQLRTTDELDSVADSWGRRTASQHRVPGRRWVRRYAASQIDGVGTTEGGGEAFYVYTTTEGRGFNILSADPTMPYVIGVSEEGRFDPARLPEGLRAFLTGCVRQASYSEGRVGEQAVSYVRSRIVPKVAVLPLLGNREWGQEDPYNMLCRAKYTGCVATALAQIMANYKWPVEGRGRVSYETRTTQTPVTVVMDGTTYDWEYMCDSYASLYTSRQGNAVATLMKHVGAAVQMDYTDEGSGAYDSDIAQAMYRHFDYDDEMKLHARWCFTADGWDEMLQEELACGRPIFYSGSDAKEGGHAFVIDGVDSDGLYHVNWGWDGSENGYYAITALKPTNTDHDYSYNCMAMAGLVPEDGVKSDHGAHLLSYRTPVCDNNLMVMARNVGTRIRPNEFYNVGSVDFDGEVGLQLRGKDGQTHIVGTTASVAIPATEKREVPEVTLSIPDDLADGTYSMCMVSRQKDGKTWHEMEYDADSHSTRPNTWEITVKGENYGVNNSAMVPLPPVTMSYTSHVVEGGEEASRDMAFGLTVSELSNVSGTTFKGVFQVVILDEGGNVVASTGKTFIESEGLLPDYYYSYDKSFTNCAVPDDLKPGHYYVMLGAKANGSDTWTVATAEDGNAPIELWVTHSHRTVGIGIKPIYDYVVTVEAETATVAAGETYKARLTCSNWSVGTTLYINVTAGAPVGAELAPITAKLAAGSETAPKTVTMEYADVLTAAWGGECVITFSNDDDGHVLCRDTVTVTGVPVLTMMTVIADSTATDIAPGSYKVSRRIGQYAYNIQHPYDETLRAYHKLLLTDEADNIIGELKDGSQRTLTLYGQGIRNSSFASGYIPDDLPDGRYRLYPAVEQREEPYERALMVPANDTTRLYTEIVLRRPFVSIGTGEEPEELYDPSIHTLMVADSIGVSGDSYGEWMRSWGYYFHMPRTTNLSAETFNGYFSVVIADDEGKTVFSSSSNDTSIKPDESYGYWGMVELMAWFDADIPNGHYKVYFTATNTDYDETVAVQTNKGKGYVDVTVGYDYINIGSTEKPRRSFRTVIVEAPDVIYDTREYHTRLRVTNYGEDDAFYGQMYYYDSAEEYHLVARFDTVRVAPGQTVTVDCRAQLSDLTAGEYNVCFEDANQADLTGDSLFVQHTLRVVDAPVPVGIDATQGTVAAQEAYDLTGRRIVATRPRQLYIQGGKVRVR